MRGAVVFYESPRRLKKTLAVIVECFPQAEVAIGRELTKLHEEIVTMSVADAEHWAGTHATLKGEAVVMVYTHAADERAGTVVEPGDVDALVEAARRGYQDGLTLKDLLGRYQDCGFSRSDLYRYLLEAKASVDSKIANERGDDTMNETTLSERQQARLEQTKRQIAIGV